MNEASFAGGNDEIATGDIGEYRFVVSDWSSICFDFCRYYDVERKKLELSIWCFPLANVRSR